jgi:hypothetical protein
MTVGRRIWLLMAVALGLTGCRAAGTGSLSLNPRPGLAQKSFDVDEFVAEHNRNADAIESLEARPSIGVTMEKWRHFAVDGKLAIERPRNFDLELSSLAGKKGDIGSNAEEFWYWIANKEQPYVYWCRYDELGSSSLPVTYQPDWIIEALGMKPIPPEEAAMIQVRNGVESGTTILTFPAVRDQGEAYTREMVVSTKDRRIKKLLIFSEKPRILIAEALPSNYQAYPDGTAGAASQGTCYLPQRLKLDWKREQFVLDVALQDVKLNQFDHANSAEMFVEPEMTGYTRRNLAEMSRGSRPERRTTTRETIPPPDARNGIRLGRPAPMPDDEPVVPNLGRRNGRPAPASSDPPLPTLDELVGAPGPRAPSSGPPQSAMFTPAPTAGMTIEQ